VFGDHTRAIKFVDFLFAAGADGIKVLEPKKFLDPRIFYNFIRAIKLPDKGYARHFQHLRVSKIAIPPWNEQTRIADKLDTLLLRVDACRERLNRMPLILKRFRRAVIAAATSGQLTEDWRAENHIADLTASSEIDENIRKRRLFALPTKRIKEPVEPDLKYWSTKHPGTWETASVSAFAECLDHMRIPVKRDDRKVLKGLYPYYGANGIVDLVDEYIFDGELILVTEDETFYGREKPIAYRVSGKCWVNNHAHVLRTDDKASANYLCYCIMYYNVLPWLTGTTGRAKLTQAVLNSLPIAVPPKQEMNEIVNRVETLFAFADRLESRYRSAHIHVERLTPVLLAKAFRGELVPQDPNDESASVLLERIRAANVTAEENATTPRRRKAPVKSPNQDYKPNRYQGSHSKPLVDGMDLGGES
jgi:type I restriction enzyme S subunit